MITLVAFALFWISCGLIGFSIAMYKAKIFGIFRGYDNALEVARDLITKELWRVFIMAVVGGLITFISALSPSFSKDINKTK